MLHFVDIHRCSQFLSFSCVIIVLVLLVGCEVIACVHECVYFVVKTLYAIQ